jgi:hypothetical protein
VDFAENFDFLRREAAGGQRGGIPQRGDEGGGQGFGPR